MTDKINLDEITQEMIEAARIQKKTTTEFASEMRAAIEKVVDGSEPFMRIPLAFIESHIDNPSKMTASYIRTTLNRVPSVKALGNVSVKREEADGADYYKVTINRSPKRKVITNDDLPALQARAVNKKLQALTDYMPNVTDLEGEQLQGAIIGIQRFQVMIKSMMEAE